MKKLLALFILLLFSSISVSAMEKVKHEGSIMNEELKITDPDFYEISNHFIYEEAAKVGNLSTKEQELIRIVVLTVNQQPDSLKNCVKEALKNGVTPVEIKEAVYQTAPYAGISRAEIAVKAVNEVFKKEGIKLPVESQKTTSADNRYDKGLATQVKIFGEGMKSRKAEAPEGQKHIPEFLSDYCFGDFYTRNGLDLRERELLTLCMLVALGDTESQIKGHIQGNLNMGNNKDTLIAAIAQCLPFIGFPRTLNAMKYLNETVKE